MIQVVLLYFIFLSAVAFAVELELQTSGVSGVDVSTLTTSSAASCFVSSGVSFYIPRGYKSSGSVDTNVCSSLTAAAGAGIKYRDVYMFPCPSCSKSAGTQLSELISYLASNCKSSWSGRVWLDVEGSQYWLSSYSLNKAWYQTLVDACSTYKTTCGIYTSKSQWTAIFGDTSFSYGSELPLWYPHYDNNPSFSDFAAFGGWVVPYAKQYWNTNTYCSQGVDNNWAPLWSDTNPTPSTGACTHLGYYCGGDGLGKNVNNLYYCSAAGASPVLSSSCSHSCVTMPSGQDDRCATSGSCSNVYTGYYCGGDKVAGEANVLYLCEASIAAGASYCSKGCTTASSGHDDYCTA